MIVPKSAVQFFFFVYVLRINQTQPLVPNNNNNKRKSIRAWKRSICSKIKIVAYRKLRVCIINIRKKKFQTNRWFLLLIFGFSDSEPTIRFFFSLSQLTILVHSSSAALARFVRLFYFILRELFVCNCVCISTVLYHLSDAITSRLFYIWCVSERKTNAKMVPRRLYYCLIRVSIHIYTNIRTHTLHISTNKKRQINK